MSVNFLWLVVSQRLCIPGHHGAIEIGLIVIFFLARKTFPRKKKLMKKIKVWNSSKEQRSHSGSAKFASFREAAISATQPGPSEYYY